MPKPGSDEALDRGCTCPVMDNGHGRRSSENCPLHKAKEDSCAKASTIVKRPPRHRRRKHHEVVGEGEQNG